MTCTTHCRHVGGLPMEHGRVIVPAWGRAIPHEWVDLDTAGDDFGERVRMVRAVMLSAPLVVLHESWRASDGERPTE